MRTFLLCPTCRRHVFEGDPCPFCAGDRTGAGSAARAGLGVRTRARLAGAAAGAIVLGSFGCAYGAPDYDVDAGDARTDVVEETSVDTGASDTGALDAGADASSGG
jgi:hypothetical protein